IAHAQWTPYALVQELVERLAGDALDDPAHQDEIPVAVDHAVARLVRERSLVHRAQELRAAGTIAPERRTGDETTAVGEQHAHRNPGLVGCVELGQVVAYGPVQIEPARFFQDHRG